MKRIYEKPTFVRKGKLSAITSANGAGSIPSNGAGPAT
ncbi:MAG: putative RiPP precursor [Mesorhizobium sp.]|nr:putative RiPP precursor [Mesorhizobium sp.]RWL83685.1 MAG: putative RiPP precursor [Mesorhizobium sp.]RWL90837.1 MAG: putative RiPP precursor [Mesorhizobium sp.]RWL93323.1 MAG: putative RiPP precursor [Mesorhizobium sp.]RWL98500.1 MAG: putative RiPP precursor [Mesorhizobium sp.]TIP39040.1 MAG: putative RiPP precursor [Mesorhizobium sp.]